MTSAASKTETSAPRSDAGSLTIVFAVPDFEPAVGGTTRQTGLQARALARRGHRVVVVTRRTSDSWRRREVLDGLEIHRVGRPGRGRLTENLSVLSLARWLRRHRDSIDVFQTVMWADAGLAATIAGILDRTVVLWAIRDEAREAFAQDGSPARRLKHLLRCSAHRRCRHVVLTDAMREELRDLDLASEVIPVPVDSHRFHPPSPAQRREARKQLEIAETAFAIAYVGHLQERKRVDRLITAFAAVAARDRTSRLLLVGGSRGAADDVEKRLRDQARALGVADQVIFYGALEAPERQLWAADAFVLPSEREGMPNSILEAMSCGLPCIAPASAGGAEILDESCGIVPPSGEPDDLVAALERLRRDPEGRAELGRAAQGRALRFDIERVIAAYERLYADVTGDRASRRSLDGATVVHVIPLIETPDSPPFHGAENHLFTLIDGQVDAGLTVKLNPLILRDGPRIRAKLQELRERGVETRCVPVLNRRGWKHLDRSRRIVGLAGSLAKDARAILRLTRALREQHPEIVHTHLDYADFCGQTAAFLSRAPTRVSSNHNNEPYYARLRWRLQLRLLSRIVTRYIAISHAVKQHLIDCAGIDPDKVDVVQYGAQRPAEPMPPADAKASLGLPDDRFVVGFVGRLEAQKNLDCLIDAFDGLPPEFVGVIVGEGSQRKLLERRIAELGVDVRVVGHRSDAAASMRAFDVLCLPSKWEGLGLVLVEAMLQGVAVIGARVGAIAEVLAGGRYGHLFDPDDPDELRALIRHVREHPDESREMCQRARAYAETAFSVDRMVAETNAVYSTASS